jgi:xylulokinase
MILAHDLGTTGNKASLYTDSGEIRASVTVTYPADFAAGGKAEQNALDWWNAVAQATRELLKVSKTHARDVSVVCFSGQMMGAVFLDAHGVPVRPAIIWADTRSQRECDAMLERVGMERAYAITGHRLNPTYSLTKIMMVRDREPEVWTRVRHAVLAKDYVAYRLTDRLATDPSDASSTNVFDQRAGRWSTELLEAAGIDVGLLPEVVPSTTVLGGVTHAAALETGLLEGTPVVLGGGDGPCAALGAGIISSQSGAYAYLGSSSWISLASDQPLHDPRMRTMTFDHVIEGRFVPTATMQAGGASMEWIADILEPGRNAGRYDRLNQAAFEVSAAADDLFFLPHILGERSPYWNPRARGAFVGLCKHHTPGHMTRAVLEGVAFNLYTGLRAFLETGASIERVDAIGGGAKSDVWLQLMADIWGVPVRRRSLVDEANSLGAAVVGGVGIGALRWEDAPKRSGVTATFTPDGAQHKAYQQRYPQFLDAYERLEPWFNSL